MPPPTQADLMKWKKEFKAHIHNDPTTQRTWQEIERAGIDCWAAFLLYWYAKGHFAVKDFADRNWKAVEDVRTARRALRKAQSKKGNSREAMFVKRAQEKITAAVSAPWINPYNSPYGTVADTAVAMGNPVFDQMPSVMAKAGEAVRRSGTMTLLCTLQLYAGKHGVQLGLRRLSGLAYCANDKRLLNVQNLSRFFNLPDVQRTASLLLADFESYLPIS